MTRLLTILTGLLASLAVVAPALAQTAPTRIPRDFDEMRTADGIVAFHNVVSCYGEENPGRAARWIERLLDPDEQTWVYRDMSMSSRYEDCGRRYNTTMQMEAATFLYRGVLAEGVVRHDLDVLRSGKLADVAPEGFASEAPEPLDLKLERFAFCVVKAAPAEMADLFATEVSSAEEANAMGMMGLQMSQCVEGDPANQPYVAPLVLRTHFALAAYQLAGWRHEFIGEGT